MKRYSILTLVVLVAGLGLNSLQAEEGADAETANRLDRLEKTVEVMNIRLLKLEGFMKGLEQGLGTVRKVSFSRSNR